MTPAQILSSEYGVSTYHQWARICTGPMERHIDTVQAYVAECRRLDPTLHPSSGWRADGRLVAVGFRRVPPREWILGERRDGGDPRTLQDYVAYWASIVGRPSVVGSSLNRLNPDEAYTCWRAGVRPEVVLALGRALIRPDGGLHHLSRAHMISACRAARRASYQSWECDTYRVASPQLLVSLGKLCPELQRVALDSIDVESLYCPARDRRRRARITDVDWEIVAHAQTQLADGGLRMRVAYAWPRGCPRREPTMPPWRVRQLMGADTTLAEARELLASSTYAGVPLHIAASLVRGETPGQISDGRLTEEEADRWLRESPSDSPWQWMVDRLPKSARKTRSVPVVRWLLAVLDRGEWSQLDRELTARCYHRGGDATVTVSLRQCIWMLGQEDLPSGAATSVEEVYEITSRRLSGERIYLYE